MSGHRPDATAFSAGTAQTPTPTKPAPSNKKGSAPASPEGPSRSRRSSVNSDGGTKFTLRDLLGGNATKLTRKGSARSTASSKRSDSEGGGRSVAGDSTASLLKKYGICERVAIGKGATSVVRLAHKWDRTEEKLYAVKVRASFRRCFFVAYIC